RVVADTSGQDGSGGTFNLSIYRSRPDGGGTLGDAGLVITGRGVFQPFSGTINTSSHFGNGGNVVINILDGPQGEFTTNTAGDMANGGNDRLTFNMNSVFGNGGNFFATVGGPISTVWSVNTNGQNGGTIFVRSGGWATINGNLVSDGSLSQGGNVVLSTYGSM